MFSLESPISASLFSVVLGIIIIFIYNKTKNNDGEKVEYLKISLLIFFVTYTTMYFHKNTVYQQGGSKIMTGNPSF
jgi:hypothetical protein